MDNILYDFNENVISLMKNDSVNIFPKNIDTINLDDLIEKKINL